MVGLIMKKKIIIVIVIIILIVISLLLWKGSLTYSTETKEEKYEFTVILDPETDGHFFVYVPIPINISGKPYFLMNHLEITEGKGDFEIIQMNNTYALNISSTSRIVVSAYLKTNTGILTGYINYSMSSGLSTGHPVFSIYSFSSINSRISFSSKLRIEGTVSGSVHTTGSYFGTYIPGYRETTLKNGWNTIKGDNFGGGID